MIHPAPPTRRHVLVVEMAADAPFGHYPVAFAQLADALRRSGCTVTALTRRGWCLADDPASPPLDVRAFGRGAERAFTWAARVGRLRPRRSAERLEHVARTVVVGRVADRLAARLGCTDVILVTRLHAPAASLVGRHGRWLSYQFTPPDPSAVDRAVTAMARWRARRHAPRLRVATHVEVARAAWEETAPWLRPVRFPFIAARRHDPIPDARARRGLPADVPLALAFGQHPGKDPDVVWEAFTALPEWQLVVAGSRAADTYRAWAARAQPEGPTPILVDGFVDETTRAELHAAADLMVMSFRPDVRADSGNLVDAVSWGLPIVCSSPCPSADTVERYGLGRVFAAGDPAALAVAVRSAPRHPDPDGLARARSELGDDHVAARNLEALDGIDRSDPTHGTVHPAPGTAPNTHRDAARDA